MALVEAKEQNLGDIFSRYYEFKIPPYQRPYAWDTEHTDELLIDVLEAMERDEDYFLGNIVLIKSDGKPKAQVVDGQQRLITLTILLCVLRELLADDNTAQHINGYIYEEGRPLENITAHYRLSIRDRDRRFFVDNIQVKGKLVDFVNQGQRDTRPSDSQKHVWQNAKHLWKKLSDDKNKAKELATFLVQRCYLVVASAKDFDSAYRIFTVMNTRGLDLASTDVLKAEITGEIPEKDRKSYTDKWENIEEHLGRDDFGELFSHIRMIYAKDKLRSNIIQEFKRTVLKSSDRRKTKFIDSILEPFSDSYIVVSKSSYIGGAFAGEINTYLDYLNWLNNADWLPPAILYFHHYRNDEAKLHQFVCDLERIAYFHFIKRSTVNERINRYAEIIRSIEKNGNLEGVGSSLQLTRDEVNTFVETLNGDFYQRLTQSILLRRINSMLTEETTDYSKSSVEYVLPLEISKNSEWTKSFPSEEIQDEWKYKIANLVLLHRKRNARAKEYNFADKKHEYFFVNDKETPFALTNQLMTITDWTPDILKDRQSDLIALIKDAWRLN